MVDIFNTSSIAQEEALRELFRSAASRFNNPELDDRQKSRAFSYVFQGWIVNSSTRMGSTVQWREAVVKYIEGTARALDQAAFRNMNTVRPKALWGQMYTARVEAYRAAFYAYAQRVNFAGLALLLKVSPAITPLAPGVYNMTVDSFEYVNGILRTTMRDHRGTILVDSMTCRDTADYMWLDFDEVEEVTFEYNHEHDTEVLSMFKNVRTVMCVFSQDNRKYAYLTDDTTIEVGDLCVVDVNGATNIVKVAEVSEGRDEKATKWIVQKVDFTAYKDRQAKFAKAKELKRVLDEAVERKRKMVDYESILGDGDEDLRKVLEEFKALQG